MQLFSGDAIMFFRKINFFIAHENMKIALKNSSKSTPIFFSIANQSKISPNLIFCSIKKSSCATSI